MQETRTFADFGLHPDLVSAVADSGIISPFPIQAMTLPVALSGHDIIGQAKTGTGKTLGFGIPLLVARTAEKLEEVKAEIERDGGTAYVSWNGSTDVARWQLLAGPAPNDLVAITSRARAGFETAIPARTASPWIRVRALGATGAVLGSSRAVRAASEDVGQALRGVRRTVRRKTALSATMRA